jgi:GNAT superfamily N-acetyltransferase
MAKIREIKDTKAKAEITERILRALPDWFELEQGVLDFIKNVKDLSFFGAEINDEIVGFIAVENYNEFAVEIHVMGVLPRYRNQGLGRQLVDFVWNKYASLGKKYLTVKTLDESAGDKFYEKTRKFYLSAGFVPVMMLKTIWSEDNPCVIMVKNN